MSFQGIKAGDRLKLTRDCVYVDKTYSKDTEVIFVDILQKQYLGRVGRFKFPDGRVRFLMEEEIEKIG